MPVCKQSSPPTAPSTLISVIVPCHNEEQTLPLYLASMRTVATEIHAAHPAYSLELILVDDGSTDGTLDLMRRAAQGADTAQSGNAARDANTTQAAQSAQSENPNEAARSALAERPSRTSRLSVPGRADTTVRSVEILRPKLSSAADAVSSTCDAVPLFIRWISFSRNFGKEAALLAGLERARGDFVAVMDADLQDPPALLPRMLDMLLEHPGELDCVAARRATRTGEGRVRSFASSAFYGVMRWLTRMDIADGARDFRLMTRPVVDAVLSLPERNRFSKGIFAWVGFRTAWLAYDNEERVGGRSSWNLRQLLAYALDGIMAFSTVPLAIASVAGMLLALASGAALIFIVVRALLFGDAVAGWPSLVSIIVFIGGLQLMGLGIIGQYLAKTYTETKARPHYLIREEGPEWTRDTQDREDA